MYVCMYVCMYVYIYISIPPPHNPSLTVEAPPYGPEASAKGLLEGLLWGFMVRGLGLEGLAACGFTAGFVC